MIKILGKTETGIYVDEVTPATIYPIYRGIIANTDKHIKFFGESEVETFMTRYKTIYEEELKRRWPNTQPISQCKWMPYQDYLVEKELLERKTKELIREKTGWLG